MKKYLPLLLIAVVIIALNISEKNQPQNKLLISGIAVEEGEKEDLKFTFSIMEGEEDDLKFNYKSAEAKELSEAVKSISETEGKETIFSLCRWLILSNDLKNDVQQAIIENFINDHTVTPKLSLFISENGVTDYMAENQIETEKLLSLPEKNQTLPDYVNDGVLLNTLTVTENGLKTLSE